MTQQIAEIWFTYDLDEAWYTMREPSGRVDSWEDYRNAINFCKDQGWRVIWIGETKYKPDDFERCARGVFRDARP